MFLGPWHEMKKKPKYLIHLGNLEPKIIIDFEDYSASSGSRKQQTSRLYKGYTLRTVCTLRRCGSGCSVAAKNATKAMFPQLCCEAMH